MIQAPFVILARLRRSAPAIPYPIIIAGQLLTACQGGATALSPVPEQTLQPPIALPPTSSLQQRPGISTLIQETPTRISTPPHEPEPVSRAFSVEEQASEAFQQAKREASLAADLIHQSTGDPLPLIEIALYHDENGQISLGHYLLRDAKEPEVIYFYQLEGTEVKIFRKLAPEDSFHFVPGFLIEGEEVKKMIWYMKKEKDGQIWGFVNEDGAVTKWAGGVSYSRGEENEFLLYLVNGEYLAQSPTPTPPKPTERPLPTKEPGFNALEALAQCPVKLEAEGIPLQGEVIIEGKRTSLNHPEIISRVTFALHPKVINIDNDSDYYPHTGMRWNDDQRTPVFEGIDPKVQLHSEIMYMYYLGWKHAEDDKYLPERQKVSFGDFLDLVSQNQVSIPIYVMSERVHFPLTEKVTINPASTRLIIIYTNKTHIWGGLSTIRYDRKRDTLVMEISIDAPKKYVKPNGVSLLTNGYHALMYVLGYFAYPSEIQKMGISARNNYLIFNLIDEIEKSVWQPYFHNDEEFLSVPFYTTFSPLFP